jgi:hypothetical protein
MRSLYQVLFGVFVGLLAAGLVSLLDLSATLMFGVGMLYGSLAQLLAQRIFAERPRLPRMRGLPNLPRAHEALEPPTLTDSATR